MATEIAPLSPGEGYYKPTGREPVTVSNRKPCFYLWATRSEICSPTLISSEIMWANMSVSIWPGPGWRDRGSPERRCHPCPRCCWWPPRKWFRCIQPRAAARQHLPRGELRVSGHVRVIVQQQYPGRTGQVPGHWKKSIVCKFWHTCSDAIYLNESSVMMFSYLA